MQKKLFLSVTTTLMLTQVSAIEMTDYMITDSHYQDAYVNGHLNVNSGNQEQTSYDLHLNANLKTVKTTKSYSWDFAIDGNSDFSRGSNNEDSSLKSYNTTAVSHFDKYLKDDDKLFVYGAANLGYRKAAESDKADDPFTKVGTGMGYGRVYNATPLAKALRIVEDLLEYSLISNDLSDKGYLALAAIIDKEDEYESKYGVVEYKKYWYEAMEQALKNDGALKQESLGAFGIVRISEILDIEKVSNRIHGWKVRGGVGKILSNYDGQSKDATLDAGFEYGLPIGHESQFSENLYLSKLLDDTTDIEFSLVNIMEYTYEVSDAIDWENNWALGYQAHDVQDDFMSNTFSTGFRYYLANRLSFETTLSVSKINSGVGEERDWNKVLFSGVTYRLK